MESFRFYALSGFFLASSTLALTGANTTSAQEIRGLDIQLGLADTDRLHVLGGLTYDGSTLAATLGTAFPAYSSVPYFPGFVESGAGEAVPLVDSESGELLVTATDIAPDGSVVTGAALVDQSQLAMAEAAIWRPDGTIQRLGRLPGSPDLVTPDSIAWASSLSGEVVVGNAGNAFGESEAFRWTASGGMEGLGFLAGPGTYPAGERNGYAIDVSADGRTIAGNSDRAAFVFDEVSGMRSLGFLESHEENPSTYATAVSGDGTVVVGVASAPNGVPAFRWAESTGLQPISPATNTGISLSAIPHDTSERGAEIVGTYFDEFGLYREFIWSEAFGFSQLSVFLEAMGVDVSDWEILETAFAISQDGKSIAGIGIKEIDGDRRSQLFFVAKIPEPSVSLLLLLGLAVLGSDRRDR